MPKVSVIIPTHDRIEYLRAAITSVLKQTFQDFELIVVDDASGDNNFGVVSSFHDERIKFIRHETRKGGSAARNSGIINSTCDYIAFLDDDDEWFPDKLAKQMAVMLASPSEVGCIYTGYLIVDRFTERINGESVPSKRGDLAKDLLRSNCIGGTSSVLLKRECLKKVGMFDESLPSFQDYDLWIRISKKFRFDYIAEPLLKYFMHQKKIWTNLEALTQGIAIMLGKYGDSCQFRKYFSYQYLSLGVRYCDRGNASRGRESYLKAIKLYPFEIRHYFNFFLSFLGAEISKSIRQTKEKIAGSV